MNRTSKLKTHLKAALIIAVIAQITGIQVLFAAQPITDKSSAETQDGAIITVRGDNTVLLNGQRISTGSAVISGAQIETLPGGEAEVRILPVGTLRIYQRTKLVINFDNNRADVTVERGCASLFVAQNYNAAMTLPGGERKVSQAGNPSELNSCDENAIAAAALPPVAASASAGGLSLPVLLALVIGGGAAAAIAVGVAINNDNEPDSASPFRP